MIIRPLAPADHAEWLRMRVQLWPDSAGDPPELLREYSGGSANRAVLVAPRDGGGLRGFIELSLREYADGCDSSPVGYIEGWWVDADSRGAGVGRALVAAGEEWARARGCVEMASDTEVENVASQRAHVALGYRETERLVIFARRLTRA
ncbi:MAG TPA: GNAT family N-acetyltransferase [Polyangia bacterium]|nr:GNAT family N-acetyltransferase [Polyangia bacterium]